MSSAMGGAADRAAGQVERYEEEWLADLERVPGKITKLVHACGVVMTSVPRLRTQFRRGRHRASLSGVRPSRVMDRIGVDESHYDLERNAVRAVLADASGRVLLFHVLTPDEAPDGWWELPGGGVDPGETYLDATIREIREETGLILDPAQISAPTWRRDSTWYSRGKRRLQHEIVVYAQLATDQAPTTECGRALGETEDHITARWWQASEITRSHKRFYPSRLPELLPRFLAGEEIHEPFERWN